MSRRLAEWLKKLRGEPAEYASEPDCADCPDYDDCANPWICIAAVDDY
jgi:hypothetical protein